MRVSTINAKVKFNRQYSAAAEPLHLHPPSSLTPAPSTGPVSVAGHQLSLQAPPTGPSAAARHQPSPDPPSRPLPGFHLWSDSVPGPPGPLFVIQESEV